MKEKRQDVKFYTQLSGMAVYHIAGKLGRHKVATIEFSKKDLLGK